MFEHLSNVTPTHMNVTLPPSWCKSSLFRSLNSTGSQAHSGLNSMRMEGQDCVEWREWGDVSTTDDDDEDDSTKTVSLKL